MALLYKDADNIGQYESFNTGFFYPNFVDVGGDAPSALGVVQSAFTNILGWDSAPADNPNVQWWVDAINGDVGDPSLAGEGIPLEEFGAEFLYRTSEVPSQIDPQEFNGPEGGRSSQVADRMKENVGGSDGAGFSGKTPAEIRQEARQIREEVAPEAPGQQPGGEQPEPEPEPIGETFTLTEGSDYVASELPAEEERSEDVTYEQATGKNDTVEASIYGFMDDEESTLNADDQIDGGSGTDTLEASLSDDFDGFSDSGGMSSVENVTLTNATGDDEVEFSAAGVEGAEKYDLDAAEGGIALTELAEAGIGVETNQQDGNLSLSFASGATEAEENALDLTLNEVGEYDDSEAAEHTALGLDLTDAQGSDDNGITDLGVSAEGGWNVFNASGAGNAETLTVNGDGSLRLEGVAASTSSLDASELGGELEADLTGADEVTELRGSQGDSEVDVTGSGITAERGSVIDGGGGENRLVIEDANGSLRPEMTGFQTVELDTVTSSFELREDDYAIEGLESLEVAGQGGNEVRLYDIGAEAFTAELNGSGNDGGGEFRYDGTGDFTLNVDGGVEEPQNSSVAVSSDVLAKEVDGVAEVNVEGYAAMSGNVDVRSADTAVLNISEGLDEDGETNYTHFDGSLVADAASVVRVDAEGEFSGGTIDAANATEARFDIGEHGSTVSGGSDLDAVETLSVETEGTTEFKNTFKSAQDVSITGEMDLSSGDYEDVTFSGGLGSEGLEENVNVDGTGLTGDLDLGNLGGDGVSVNVSGSDGDLTVGDVNADEFGLTADGLMAADSGNGVEVGNIDARTATLSAVGAEADFLVSGAKVEETFNLNASEMAGDLDISGGSVTTEADGKISLNAQGMEGDIGSAQDVNLAVGDGTTGEINVDVRGVMPATGESSGSVNFKNLSAADVTLRADGLESDLSVSGDIGGGSGEISLSLNGSEGAVSHSGNITGETVSILAAADSGGAEGDIVLAESGIDASELTVEVDTEGKVQLASGNTINVTNAAITAEAESSSGIDLGTIEDSSSGVVAEEVVLDLYSEAGAISGNDVTAQEIDIDATAEGSGVNLGTLTTEDLTYDTEEGTHTMTLTGMSTVDDSASFLSGNDAGAKLDIDVSNGSGSTITLGSGSGDGDNGLYAAEESKLIGGSGDTLQLSHSSGQVDLTNATLDGFSTFDGVDGQFRVNTESVNNLGWDAFASGGSGEIVMNDGDTLEITGSGSGLDGADLVLDGEAYGSGFATVSGNTSIDIELDGQASGADITLDLSSMDYNSGTVSLADSGTDGDFSGDSFSDVTVDGFAAGSGDSVLDLSAVESGSALSSGVDGASGGVTTYDGYLVLTGTDSGGGDGGGENIFAIGYSESNGDLTLDLTDMFAGNSGSLDFIDGSGLFDESAVTGSGDWSNMLDPSSGLDFDVSADDGSITLVGTQADDGFTAADFGLSST